MYSLFLFLAFITDIILNIFLWLFPLFPAPDTIVPVSGSLMSGFTYHGSPLSNSVPGIE